ncbi:MAG: glycosyl hydrolase [Steroidobacteraceae bacterium]
MLAKNTLVKISALLAVSCASLAHAAPLMGVYKGPAPKGTNIVDTYNTWLGGKVSLVEDFEANDTYANMSGPSWQLSAWDTFLKAHSGNNLILSVPMLQGAWNLSGPDGVAGTSDDVSFANCSSGLYNSYWATLADNLAAKGMTKAYLRLGWEFDGGWYTWRASTSPSGYAGCFRQIVQTMRARHPEAAWRFVYNPTTVFSQTLIQQTYPGNDVVDVIGIDVYDQSWNTGSGIDAYYPTTCTTDACKLTYQKNAWTASLTYINYLRDFAKTNGKPFAFPEWGVVNQSQNNGHGGGDNTYFIQQMYNFINDPANNVEFHVYFDYTAPDGDHLLSNITLSGATTTQFPNSAALFKQLFASTSTTTPTTPAIPLSVTASAGAAPATLATGAVTKISTTVTATQNIAAANVVMFVQSTPWSVVTSQTSTVNLVAGTASTVSWNYTVPSTLTAGSHLIGVSVYDANWKQVYSTNAAATLTVAAPPSYAVGTSTISAATVKAGQTLTLTTSISSNQSIPVNVTMVAQSATGVSGATVTQTWPVTLTANKSSPLTWTFKVPSNAIVGNAKVSLSIHSADWKLLLYKDSAVKYQVQK